MRGKEITVFVVALNSMGEPEILAYDLSVSKYGYDNGEHLKEGRKKAEEAGYQAITAFDTFDPAGKQLLHKQPVYGDQERSLADIKVAPQDQFAEILQHRIKWYLSGDFAPDELDSTSEDHIKKCIEEGYNQGELCVLDEDGDTEYRGWWSIEKE